MSQFLICVPDYKNGLIWCQHLNGNWAPPFPMSDRKKVKNPPSEEDESDTELEA